ncbi:MAG: hypothetical protein KAX49_00365 [Halanaerobiales bacterium]|nr:hypothetical protein [Halanaerobiales bacterium]
MIRIEKYKVSALLIFALILLFISCGDADALSYQLSINKIFFSEDEGYSWNARLDLVPNQGFYLDGLQIGDFYDQWGAGIEFLLFDHPKFATWGFVGVEKYKLNRTHNSFFKTGMHIEFPVSSARFALKGELVIDDMIGIFPRYQIETWLPKYFINLGVGNLFGNEDGYAFWVGIRL